MNAGDRRNGGLQAIPTGDHRSPAAPTGATASGELLRAALRYARRGWPVFPCRPRSKAPCTRNGLKDATVDLGLIEGWWSTWPDANIAIRTGSISGLLILDIDGDEGAESLRALECEHGELPCTASIVTPSGGQHFYFRHPGGEVRNSAGRLGTGLDVRGEGGCVVAPPSIGASGRRYEPDDRAPLVPPPGWLLERLGAQQAKSRPTPAAEWVTIVRDGLPEGQRNHGLARLVGYLFARDVDARLVRELAQTVTLRFRPPLTADEVDRVVESIAGRELDKRTRRR